MLSPSTRPCGQQLGQMCVGDVLDVAAAGVERLDLRRVDLEADHVVAGQDRPNSHREAHWTLSQHQCTLPGTGTMGTIERRERGGS